MRQAVLLLLAGLSLPLTGCGGGTPSAVGGTVTLDGTPVETGAVKFVRTGGGSPVAAIVTKGKFETKLAPGQYKVALYATKTAGSIKQKTYDGREYLLELTEEMIPEQYNSKSELTEVIKAGENTLTFNLQSKK